MTVTIFGATGMVGKYVVQQALAQGHRVHAFGRNIEKLIDADLSNDNLVAIKGYIFETEDIFNAIKNADAVISVLGGGFDGTDKTRSLGMKNIISQMEKANVKRIIGLGGMGVLNADEQTLIIDSPGYPPQYVPVGKEHLAAYKSLEASSLQWTFVCPPNIMDKPASEKYVVEKNYVPAQDKGEVAAGNIAHFMLKELLLKQYLQCRVGISDTD